MRLPFMYIWYAQNKYIFPPPRIRPSSTVNFGEGSVDILQHYPLRRHSAITQRGGKRCESIIRAWSVGHLAEPFIVSFCNGSPLQLYVRYIRDWLSPFSLHFLPPIPFCTYHDPHVDPSCRFCYIPCEYLARTVSIYLTRISIFCGADLLIKPTVRMTVNCCSAWWAEVYSS